MTKRRKPTDAHHQSCFGGWHSPISLNPPMRSQPAHVIAVVVLRVCHDPRATRPCALHGPRVHARPPCRPDTPSCDCGHAPPGPLRQCWCARCDINTVHEVCNERMCGPRCAHSREVPGRARFGQREHGLGGTHSRGSDAPCAERGSDVCSVLGSAVRVGSSSCADKGTCVEGVRPDGVGPCSAASTAHVQGQSTPRGARLPRRESAPRHRGRRGGKRQMSTLCGCPVQSFAWRWKRCCLG